MTIRDNIILNNIKTAKKSWNILTKWEQDFIESITRQTYPLTQRQFNELQMIRDKLK